MSIVLAYIVLCVAIMLIARRRNRDPIGWLFIAIPSDGFSSPS